MKKQINEIKKMQLIAGLITESEYQESLINEDSLEKTISFGPYTNLKYYDIPREDTVGLIVDTSDNFGKIQLSVDTKGKDFYSSKQISYLNDKLDDLAEEMSDYLTKQGIENEIVDNPIGYGQEIDNLEIEISKDDLSKLGQVNEIDEAEIKEEAKGLPFLLAKTWLDEYNGNIQFAVRTEEIIGFLYNLRDEEFKQYKEEIERMYLPYKKAKDAFEKLWDEASVYSDKDLKD